MQNIQLYEYILSGRILQNIEHQALFDAVVYVSTENVDLVETKIPVHHISTVDTHEILAQLHAYHTSYKKVLIILHDISLEYIVPFLGQYDNAHIINLGTGLSGTLAKGAPEETDIMLSLSMGYDCIEAYDFVSFFKILGSDQGKIMRVPYIELLGNLFEVTDTALPQNGLLDCRGYGLKSTTGTLLCPGSHIFSYIQTYEQLPQDKRYDGFILLNYNFEVSDALLQSLETTQSLTIMLDQATDTPYVDIIKAKLFSAGCTELEHISCLFAEQGDTIAPKELLYEGCFTL